MEKQIRILIADDHGVVRYGIKLLCKEILPNSEIFQAENFTEVLSILNSEPLDLIILDINIPGGNNIQMLDTIRLKQSKIKILMFSAYDEDIYAVRYIQAGANGYLSKDRPGKEIKNAILTILDEGKYIGESIKENILNNLLSHRKHSSNPLESLSNRELEVSRLLIQGMKITEISDALNIQKSTASTYKNRIFEKLEVNNVAELIEKFRLFGGIAV